MKDLLFILSYISIERDQFAPFTFAPKNFACINFDLLLEVILGPDLCKKIAKKISVIIWDFIQSEVKSVTLFWNSLQYEYGN